MQQTQKIPEQAYTTELKELYLLRVEVSRLKREKEIIKKHWHNSRAMFCEVRLDLGLQAKCAEAILGTNLEAAWNALPPTLLHAPYVRDNWCHG